MGTSAISGVAGQAEAMGSHLLDVHKTNISNQKQRELAPEECDHVISKLLHNLMAYPTRVERPPCCISVLVRHLRLCKTIYVDKHRIESGPLHQLFGSLHRCHPRSLEFATPVKLLSSLLWGAFVIACRPMVGEILWES